MAYTYCSSRTLEINGTAGAAGEKSENENQLRVWEGMMETPNHGHENEGSTQMSRRRERQRNQRTSI